MRKPKPEQSQYELVIAGLDETRGSWRAVAEATGVSKRTIEKIAQKVIKSPRSHHMDALAKYFREQAAA